MMTVKRVRPIGQITRGKTALNRLRQVDTYVALAWSHILTIGTPLIVDVGYGAQAWTAIEMFERWLPLNPHLRLLGVEIDPERVADANPFEQPGIIEFRLGGFNLENIIMSNARIIRAYNVLRQYDESAVEDALLTIARSLEIGGLLIEGTSNPTGRVAVFDVYQKQFDGTLAHQELVFGTNFREKLNPIDFQAVLPKRLIHHAYDDVPAAFFEAWQRSLILAKGAGKTRLRQQWINAAYILRERFGYAIDIRKRILGRGYLVLRDSLLKGH